MGFKDIKYDILVYHLHMATSFFYIYVIATSFFYIYVMATRFFYIYVLATSFFYIDIDIDIDINSDICIDILTERPVVLSNSISYRHSLLLK